MGQYPSQTKVIRVKPSQKPKPLPAPLAPLLSWDNAGYTSMQAGNAERLANPNAPIVQLGGYPTQQPPTEGVPAGTFITSPLYKRPDFLPYQQPNSSQGRGVYSSELGAPLSGNPSQGGYMYNYLQELLAGKQATQEKKSVLAQQLAENATPRPLPPAIAGKLNLPTDGSMAENAFMLRSRVGLPPNQYEVSRNQALADLEASRVREQGLQQPLPQLPFRPYSPAPLPQRQQFAAPNPPRFDGDPLAQGLAALGGFLAPEAAGQFNAAPLLAGVKQAQENYGYQHQQYQDLQGQANQQYEDALRGWQAQDAATQFNLREQAQNDKIQHEESLKRGLMLLDAKATGAGLSKFEQLTAPLAERMQSYEQKKMDMENGVQFLADRYAEQVQATQRLKILLDQTQKEIADYTHAMGTVITQVGQDLRADKEIEAKKQAANVAHLNKLKEDAEHLKGLLRNSQIIEKQRSQSALVASIKKLRIEKGYEWAEKYHINDAERAVWEETGKVPDKIFTSPDPREVAKQKEEVGKMLSSDVTTWGEHLDGLQKTLSAYLQNPGKAKDYNEKKYDDYMKVVIGQIKQAQQNYKSALDAQNNFYDNNQPGSNVRRMRWDEKLGRAVPVSPAKQR